MRTVWLTITRITNVIWELERLIECDWNVISQTRQERVFIECCKTLTKVIQTVHRNKGGYLKERLKFQSTD